MWLEALQILVERIDEHPVRQVPLELRSGPRENEVPTGIGAGGELGEKARLADSGLTRNLERGRLPIREIGKSAIERAEFLGAPHDLLADEGHYLGTRINQGVRMEKSGCFPDVAVAPPRQARSMPRYLLHHRHEPEECGVEFAAFKGHTSPL